MKEAGIKTALAAIASVLSFLFGGLDTALGTLFILVVVDFLTGIIKACIKKELSSTEMRKGILHKLCIVIVIIVAVAIDRLIVDWIGHKIELEIAGQMKTLSIRLFFVMFFCIEESLSIIENLVDCGVPFPKWVASLLKQCSDTISGESVPQFIVNIFKKLFHIDNNKTEEPQDLPQIEEKEDGEDEQNIQ